MEAVAQFSVLESIANRRVIIFSMVSGDVYVDMVVEKGGECLNFCARDSVLFMRHKMVFSLYRDGLTTYRAKLVSWT